MKIAVFHHQRVPPLHYGGTERVAAWLCKGLLEAGHQVALFAPDSNPSGLPGVSVHSWSGSLPALEQLKLCMRGSPGKGLDVLHSMVPIPAELEAELEVPVVTTIHGNGKPGERFTERAVFVSSDHARRHGRKTFVWNGLDPSEFSVREPVRSGFAFLGKTTWRVKNLRGAAELCASARVPLKIAGGNRPLGIRLESFFRPGWEWWGPVSGERKASFLAGARALLFPVLWPEPFGLVIAEALFSGTPVLATPVGSLPELLPESVGKLMRWSDQRQWLETLRRVDSGELSWSEEACIAHAERNFHYRAMTQGYLELYRSAMAGGRFE